MACTVVVACAADRPSEQLGKVATALSESCIDADLSPWRTYGDASGEEPTAHDATRSLSRSILFHIPTSARVTSGNAGDGEVHLTVRAGVDEIERCVYRGAAGMPHPEDPVDLLRGTQYLFESCDQGHSAGDALEADGLTLHVESGDDQSGPTRVLMTIEEDPDSCLPVGYLDAPPLDPTRPTEFIDVVRHIFTGPNAVQLDVAPEAIPDAEAALIHGVVVDEQGAPIAEAWAGIPDHPEFGYTYTRSDGAFDLVVRGGQTYGLEVKYLDQVHFVREVMTRFGRKYGEIRLKFPLVSSEPDPVVLIDGNSAAHYVWGGLKEDEAGRRRAALYFPSQLEVYADGDLLPSFSMSIVEATVGGDPATMTAGLNATSAFTYAADFLVQGHKTKTITFSHPTNRTPIFYAHSFLTNPKTGALLPPCAPVPMGYHDAKENRWIATPTGRVIQLLSSDGVIASVDADGDGDDDADDEAIVADEERRILAKMMTDTSPAPKIFDAGDDVWRIPLEHFTPYDANMAIAGPKDMTAPPVAALDAPIEPEPDCAHGSIIECQNATLGERIPIPGTPIALTYRSDRMPGDPRYYHFDVKVGPKSHAEAQDLLRIDVDLDILGKKFKTVSYQETDFRKYVDLRHTFAWDGKLDGFPGRVLGPQIATVTVTYAYKATYAAPGTFGATGAVGMLAAGGGGGGGGAVIRPTMTTIPARTELRVSTTFEVPIGTFDWSGLGLGGWGVDLYHAWSKGQLLLGDGGRVSTTDQAHLTARRVLTEGVPPTQIRTGSPDGTIWMLRQGSNVVWRSLVPEPGTARSFTDVTGEFRLSGFTVNGLAVSPQGGVFVCANDNKIYKLRAGTAPLHVAGGGTGVLDGGDGGDATSAKINDCRMMAADGGYIYVGGYDRIRRIEVGAELNTGGWLAKPHIDHFAGCGGSSGKTCTAWVPAAEAAECKCSKKEDGSPCGLVAENATPLATDVEISWTPEGTIGGSRTILDMASAPDGSLYYLFSNGTNVSLHRVTPDGRTHHVAGGVAAGLPKNGAAKLSPLPNNGKLAVDREGVVYIAGTSGPCTDQFTRIGAVLPDGTLSVIAGASRRRNFKDGDSASGLDLSTVASIAATHDRDGQHLFVGGRDWSATNGCDWAPVVVDITSQIGLSALGVAHKGEIFLKDTADTGGRHTKTLDAFTGLWKYYFTHAGSTEPCTNHLTRITDSSGESTRFLRDPVSCRVDYIVGPFGTGSTLGSPHVTKLEYDDGSGRLAAIKRSTTEAHNFEYWDANGLLKTFTDPARNQHSFEFWPNGELKSDKQPVEDGVFGSTTLARTIWDDGWRSELTSASLRKKIFTVQRVSGDDGFSRVKTTEHPDGGKVITTIAPSGVSETVYPNGSKLKSTPIPDPRFGMQSPTYSSTVTAPSGLARTVEVTRTGT